mmetsp:Transcript_4603/g.4362  ORF Transcript_4603/g.4362 Transcript_4603/m.4362 type:complete len:84 (+) Transcript_4603:312-563(+)
MLKAIQQFEAQLIEIKEKLTSKGINADACVNLVSAHIDILQMMGDKDTLKKAASMANTLATEHDIIRKRYWFMREKHLISLTN